MFLLVPAYPGCPGQTAVKWLLLLLLRTCCRLVDVMSFERVQLLRVCCTASCTINPQQIEAMEFEP